MSNYWERRSRFRTYELDNELIGKVDRLSELLDVYQSELIRALLADAFKRIESGELTLQPVAKVKTHRLHKLSL